MAEKFLHSNCIGTFVIEEGKAADELLFSDVTGANEKLERGEWLGEEKQLLQKHGITLFLGYKEEKPGSVKLTSDIRKLEAVAVALKQYERQIDEAITKIAKAKVKSSVEPDEIVTQAISAIQEIDKAASMLTKRLREWYGLRNPELAALTQDNARFVKELLEDKQKSEMGAELSGEDISEITSLAREVVQLSKLRQRQEKYLERRMKSVCPNIEAVAGAAIGAKLITNAGSLKNLAMMPASTLQLLGAEKSMFKFLRKQSKKMPRFGILHEHRIIAAAPESGKGKAARLLADKISIAARVDYFKGQFVGDKLAKEIEERVK